MMNPNTNSVVLLLTLLFQLPFLSLQDDPYHYGPAPSINPRLEKAYIALQAWKHTFSCDPKNTTSNWCGPDVCSYTGIFCAPAPDDPHSLTVAGIDLNHAGICGSLHDHLGLFLPDLALLHLNSNRFTGTIPASFSNLHLLFELDLSSNRLAGPFPSAVLHLPSLKFLDLRFNSFHGDVPEAIYDRPLDALFLNNNKFKLSIPSNIGNSPVSVLVLANNPIHGCFPPSIASMGNTLNELLIINTGLRSCIPPEIGRLEKLTVLDLSNNQLLGPLPESIGNMKDLEQLNVARNMLSGEVPESVCALPRLENFTFSDNFFCGEPERCMAIRKTDDRRNCLPSRPFQRPERECKAFLSRPTVHCLSNGCIAPPPPPPPPVHYHY